MIAITSGRKTVGVTAAGASHAVTRDTGDLAAQVEAFSPGGVDAVVDIAGGPLIAELMPLVRDDGRWVIAGAVAGPVVDFDLRRLYLHNISLIGSSMHTRDHFATLVDTARTGAIRPVIAARHPLADIAEAQEEFRRGQHVGKITITIE